ncbi:hypothetical protein CAJAP_07010 [Camponotus japonicus]
MSLMSLMSINQRHVRSCIIFTTSENYPPYSFPNFARRELLSLREFRELSKKSDQRSDHAKVEFRERMLDISAPRRWRERSVTDAKKSFHLRNRASCSCIGKTAPQECETFVFQIPLIERPRRERTISAYISLAN